ncbi:MAG: NAD(P)-dependent alcohol dehydrogenase, partial [Hyphomonadaceae bacterium]|nr:NAD(P)-dependent alcohol dehydrogenase [Hyphomonadaceae bacterium]
IDIQFCGVCHSDIHTARSEWPGTLYPCVPGHEIVGRVRAVGEEVSRFAVGDLVGVGCLVGSCRTCQPCRDGEEQLCDKGFIGTYNGADPDFGHTLGGYAKQIVVDEAFVLRMPANLDPAAAAPLLCAGITTYSPLAQARIGPGMVVGVAGLGGLGHMGVKIARAMGAEVVALTTSPAKAQDARRLGAHDVLVTGDEAAMAASSERFHFILDTIAADHPIDAYLSLVKRDGALCLVGAPEKPLSVNAFSILFRRRRLAGSLIGGVRETQEMLDFCGRHGITADIEMIRMDQINTAYERMLRSDVKYRFVIDMASLQEAA